MSIGIRSLAISLVGIFEPIYLYQTGYSIKFIILFYVAAYVGFFVAAPLGGRICRRYGYEHSILYSSPFLVLYYLSLFAMVYHVGFAAVSIVALVLYKMFYWPGYHANLATWMKDGERGREVSSTIAIEAVVTSFAPAIGGLIITFAGFGTLFVLVSVLIMVANIPLLLTPESFEKRNYSYGGALKRVFQLRLLPKFLSYFGYAEQIIAMVIWPIFIVIVLPSVLTVGALVSAARLVNVLVTMYVGRLADDGDSRHVLASGVVFTAGSWLFRIFAATGLGIFLTDSYYRVAKSMVVVPHLSLLYSHAYHEGNIMDEVVFREMAISTGIVVGLLTSLLMLALFPANPWTPIFICAALFSLFYLLMIVTNDVRVSPAAKKR